MHRNRKRPEIPQRGIRVPGIEGQDAFVSAEGIVVNQCDPKLPQVPVNSATRLDEGLGAICLGEH